MTSSTHSAQSIQHFHHLTDEERGRLFLVAPETIPPDADLQLRATALGATLYMPADRPDLAGTVTRRAEGGVSSMVLDLEDAVEDSRLASAIGNAVSALDELAAAGGPRRTMVFVRVRSLDCIGQITESLAVGGAALSGFVVPKFSAATGERYLREIAEAGRSLGRHLYCMPVLETERVIYRDTRDDELRSIASLLADHRDAVLALRIGATDMCGTFGIRRDRDLTIYDVRVVADAIADIVNYLGRADGTGFVISAPVWEYFADHERLFRPMLRTTPFAEHDAVRFRDKLVSRDLDGLLRELSLDRANGLAGKTVIHPSHVAAVHALAVVTHEEYRDAVDVSEADVGGVRRSEYRNKMNEPRPHRIWAQQVLRRAKVFGVTNPGVTFVDLLKVLAGR